MAAGAIQWSRCRVERHWHPRQAVHQSLQTHRYSTSQCRHEADFTICVRAGSQPTADR